jgi:ADP-dependent NAD(P)H-hydrate dehydratase / NAD(P)H-hydrate epimerase
VTLPAWLEPLPGAGEQRALDQWAISELGIPGLTLMERAGRGLAGLVGELAPSGPVAVVCGKGNNGGDGLVVARRLRERGRDVRVLLLGAPGELRGDAATNCERLPGPSPQPFDPGALHGAAAIVDAILGTGFSGEPRDPAASALAAINESAGEAVVIACDVPSGVDASTGEVAGEAVRARATATFHAAKPGLWIAPGKAHAGDVRVIDIGIPPGGPADPQIGLIGDRVTDTIPRRGRASTKFAAGSVIVCGGSIGLTGAPCMAAESAMRAGAGYVTAMIPASLNLIFETRLLEVMTVPLTDAGGSLDPGAADAVLERLTRADALVLGPGLGRDAGAIQLARNVAGAAKVPLLLDADGLNAHAGKLASLAGRPAATVLTPHAGELARLLESDSAAVGARRLHSGRLAAADADAIVVLKGDDTLVCEPGGRVGVSRGGASALATAGTGDVLSGLIGAYLSKGMDPFAAACAGVHVHARAGRLLARELGPEGVIARDVIEALPRALQEARAAGQRSATGQSHAEADGAAL